MSMEEKGNQNLGTPTFCRNGCGFYAAQAFDGMCSKCYKDVKQRLDDEGSSAVGTPTSTTAAATSPPVDDVEAVAAALGRATLGDLSVNASSNNNSPSVRPGSPSSSSESLASSALPTPASQVETACPTVPSTATTTKVTATAEVGGPTTSGATASIASTSSHDEESPLVGAPDGESAADDDKGKKPKKNRCMECRKKVGLTGFVCHCGKMFCSLHRYSDTHECTFDFKEKGQEEIRKNNPVIKGEKIQRI